MKKKCFSYPMQLDFSSLKSVFSSWEIIPCGVQTQDQKIDTYIRLFLLILIIALVLTWSTNILMIIVGILIVLVVVKISSPSREGFTTITENGALVQVKDGGQPFLPVTWPQCSLCNSCGGCSGMTRPVGDMCSEFTSCNAHACCSCGTEASVNDLAGCAITAKQEIQSSFKQDQDSYRRGMIEHFLERKQREFGRGYSNRVSQNMGLNIN